jgi:hypothetical protein
MKYENSSNYWKGNNMDKRDTFLIELQTTFDSYIKWAVSEVSLYRKFAREASAQDGIEQRDKYNRPAKNPHLEALLAVSAIEDGDLANLERTIKRTADWLKSYEHNYVFNNQSSINKIRKAVEQMNSIYHISKAYPDNAIKRTVQLRIDINGTK